MIVCICRRVSDHAIASAARNGCGSFEELQAQLGVATACGKCRDCAQENFEAHCLGVGRKQFSSGAHHGSSTSVVMLPRRGLTPAASA